MAGEPNGPEKKKGEVSVREAAQTEAESLRREEAEREKRHEPQKIVLWPPGETPIKES